MKKVARATLSLMLASAGIAGAEEAPDLSPESRRVRFAYVALAAAPADRDVQGAYLEAFPADARTFQAVFTPEDQAQLQDSHAYIASLGTIGRDLPDPTFDKVLRIAAALTWEPGGLDDLQAVTLKLALSNPQAFALAFSRLRSGEQHAVAAFLADGSLGPREDVSGLAAKLALAGHRGPARLLREEARLSEARQG